MFFNCLFEHHFLSVTFEANFVLCGELLMPEVKGEAQDNLPKFTMSIRIERKDDLSGFKYGMVVGTRQSGLSISETCVLL